MNTLDIIFDTYMMLLFGLITLSAWHSAFITIPNLTDKIDKLIQQVQISTITKIPELHLEPTEQELLDINDLNPKRVLPKFNHK